MPSEESMEKARALRNRCVWASNASVEIIATALDEAREELLDRIDGLDSDLRSAIEVAFNQGATEWVRLNYPKEYARLSHREEAGRALLDKEKQG